MAIATKRQPFLTTDQTEHTMIRTFCLIMAFGLVWAPAIDINDKLSIADTVLIYLTCGVFLIAYGVNKKQTDHGPV